MDNKNREPSDVLTAVLDNIAQAMVVIGPDFRVRAFNQRFVDLFQLPAKAFQLGNDFREVLRIWATETGQDAAMLERAIRELSMPESFVFEFSQNINGEERWCQLFHNPLPDGGCVRTFSDITDQRKIDKSVRRQKNLLAAVLRNMAQGVIVVDNEKQVLEHNARYRQLFRLTDEQPVNGTAFEALVRLWAKKTKQTDAVLRHALDRLQLEEPYRFEIYHAFDEPQWLDVFHNPLPEGGFVRTYTDITERKNLEEQLRISASIDPLTEAPNRREFMNKLNEEVARSQRYRHGLALVMVDIDHFKQVNDEWGHPVGDLALRHFVAVCQSIMRQHDKMGRVGGEEFALLLPETDHDAALHVAERLRRSIQEQPVKAGPGLGYFFLTISAGVALHKPGEEPMELWARADNLLYEAKKAERNCVKSLPA